MVQRMGIVNSRHSRWSRDVHQLFDSDLIHSETSRHDPKCLASADQSLLIRAANSDLALSRAIELLLPRRHSAQSLAPHHSIMFGVVKLGLAIC